MLVLFLFLIGICIASCKIMIKDVGVATLSRNDVDITLRNCGDCKYNVNVNMIRCCEKFDANDLDCGLMNLLGGNMGYLLPNITKNISLLYPNMYLHNRKGQCLIKLTYKTDKHESFETKETIFFDTFIMDRMVPPILRGYYTNCEYKKCQSIDEDPLDSCFPVDCRMKYLGRRNYFNRKWNRCQKVPICVADPDKQLPDVSYSPISNMCRDLEHLISVDDLKLLDRAANEGILPCESSSDTFANVRCHHGIINNETGFCVCDDGWTSAPLDKDQYEASLSIYHMCNIQMDTWNGSNNIKIKITGLLLVVFGGLTTIFTIILSICCHFLHKFIKSRKRKKMKSDGHFPLETKVSISTSDGKRKSNTTINTSQSRHTIDSAAHRDSKPLQKKTIHEFHNPDLMLPLAKDSPSASASENSEVFETAPFKPSHLSDKK